jgi:hypothetical protein
MNCPDTQEDGMNMKSCWTNLMLSYIYYKYCPIINRANTKNIDCLSRIFSLLTEDCYIINSLIVKLLISSHWSDIVLSLALGFEFDSLQSRHQQLIASS